MVIGSKERALEKLAYRYYLKNKSRNSEENWKLACVLLTKLEKRKRREYFRKQRGFIESNRLTFLLLILLILLLCVR
jgi:hypothetical protein